MRRRVRAASLLVPALVILGGCSSGSSSSPTTVAPTTATPTSATPTTVPTTTTRVTAATTTIPATATTRARASTSAPSTGPPRSATTAATTAVTTEAPSPTTDPSSDPAATSTIDPASSSTNVPAAPCDPVALLRSAEIAFGPLPPGSVLTDPRCVENYASGLLSAPGQDSAFIVFDNFEGEWLGLNLGTDQICSGADVPIEFYGPLNCGPWEG
jgi:hypothetical protein